METMIPALWEISEVWNPKYWDCPYCDTGEGSESKSARLTEMRAWTVW
jgi:hypothetical protein